MSDDVLTVDQQNIRGSDTNSLLRLYDLAQAICNTSHLQQKRARAARVIQRIAKELQKRNISL